MNISLTIKIDLVLTEVPKGEKDKEKERKRKERMEESGEGEEEGWRERRQEERKDGADPMLFLSLSNIEGRI